MVNYWVTLLLVSLLVGCGVETASTAATAGVAKAAEAREGKKQLQQAKLRLDEAQRLQLQQRDQAERAGDR